MIDKSTETTTGLSVEQPKRFVLSWQLWGLIGLNVVGLAIPLLLTAAFDAANESESPNIGFLLPISVSLFVLKPLMLLAALAAVILNLTYLPYCAWQNRKQSPWLIVVAIVPIVLSVVFVGNVVSESRQEREITASVSSDHKISEGQALQLLSECRIEHVYLNYIDKTDHVEQDDSYDADLTRTSSWFVLPHYYPYLRVVSADKTKLWEAAVRSQRACGQPKEIVPETVPKEPV